MIPNTTGATRHIDGRGKRGPRTERERLAVSGDEVGLEKQELGPRPGKKRC